LEIGLQTRTNKIKRRRVTGFEILSLGRSVDGDLSSITENFIAEE